jgi:hypothetical protein
MFRTTYNGTYCITQLLRIPATSVSHDRRVAIGNSTNALYHLPVCLIYSICYSAAGVFPSPFVAQPAPLFLSVDTNRLVNADDLVGFLHSEKTTILVPNYSRDDRQALRYFPLFHHVRHFFAPWLANATSSHV